MHSRELICYMFPEKVPKIAEGIQGGSFKESATSELALEGGNQTDRVMRKRSMSIFGTMDTRMSGAPAAMLLREGSAEFQHLIRHSTDSDIDLSSLPSPRSKRAQLTKEANDVPDSEVQSKIQESVNVVAKPCQASKQDGESETAIDSPMEDETQKATEEKQDDQTQLARPTLQPVSVPESSALDVEEAPVKSLLSPKRVVPVLHKQSSDSLKKAAASHVRFADPQISSGKPQETYPAEQTGSQPKLGLARPRRRPSEVKGSPQSISQVSSVSSPVAPSPRSRRESVSGRTLQA